jgi:hypothetical protein
MSENPGEQEQFGHLTDEEEAAEQSSDTGAAEPGTPHAPATPDND